MYGNAPWEFSYIIELISPLSRTLYKYLFSWLLGNKLELIFGVKYRPIVTYSLSSYDFIRMKNVKGWEFQLILLQS